MRTSQDRDAEREAWNAALASGDTKRIAAARDAILRNIARHIVEDDEYIERTR